VTRDSLREHFSRKGEDTDAKPMRTSICCLLSLPIRISHKLSLLLLLFMFGFVRVWICAGMVRAGNSPSLDFGPRRKRRKLSSTSSDPILILTGFLVRLVLWFPLQSLVLFSFDVFFSARHKIFSIWKSCKEWCSYRDWIMRFFPRSSVALVELLIILEASVGVEWSYDNQKK